jgi:hypothetical protein
MTEQRLVVTKAWASAAVEVVREDEPTWRPKTVPHRSRRRTADPSVRNGLKASSWPAEFSEKVTTHTL